MRGRSVGFLLAVKLGFRKYFDFQGRAQRSEFWWFQLFLTLFPLLGDIIDYLIMGDAYWDSDWTPIASCLSLITFIPWLSVGWRRMHDIGRSGWWSLLPFGSLAFTIIAIITLGFTETISVIAVVGLIGLTLASSIYILFLFCKDSEIGANSYGPSPKYGPDVSLFD